MKANIFLVAALCGLWAQAASISSQVVRQNWPWDRKVTVNYVLDAAYGETWDVDLKVTDAAGNDVTGLSAAQSGDCQNVAAGEHDLVWDPVLAGVSIASQTLLKFTLVPKAPVGKKYIVIDLSAGIGGTYTVTQLDAEPSGGFNTDEYKTSKLVFRRCRAGTYVMGSPTTEEGREGNLPNLKETQHKVTLTKDFYIGIFEFTEGQSSRVWTTNVTCAANSKKVLNTVKRSWAYRGSDGNWPANSAVESGSLVGRVRAGVKSGLPAGYVIDLPTEAQWEYACRANTSTAWNDGSDPSYHVVYGTGAYGHAKDEPVTGYVGDYNVDVLGQYCCKIYPYSAEWTKTWYWAQNTPPGTVGRYLPNAWGLYDMHGNDAELCVDAHLPSTNNDLGSADQTDPWYAGKSDSVISRGGGWVTSATGCRSAARSYHYLPTANGDQSYCVRLAIVPEKK